MKKNNLLKATIKATGAICAAAGILALSSVIASSSAVETMLEGMKTAKKSIKRIVFSVEDNSDND